MNWYFEHDSEEIQKKSPPGAMEKFQTKSWPHIDTDFFLFYWTNMYYCSPSARFITNGIIPSFINRLCLLFINCIRLPKFIVTLDST